MGGFGGSVLAMIQSLKYNQSIRPKHIRIFDMKGQWGKHRPLKRKSRKLTIEERLAIRAMVKKSEASRSRKIFIAFAIAAVLTAILVWIVLNYFDTAILKFLDS
ncbi:hypothetical protein ACE01N_13485 [Saccharicrinis sp. FJH2]|uniref:hypothetical protein n=1 Tax=Saccharicrinis sp. FJH65 TaxID=3344659 RepID=UPI0035F3CDD7